MRLFVAIEPPDQVLDQVAALVDRLRSDQPAHAPDRLLRWTTRVQWHITLAFLGEVGEEPRQAFGPRLTRAASRHDPLRLRLSGGGRFGGRVLWTGVEGDPAALTALARSVRAGARRSGVAVEERTYRPHLTLARAREPMDLRPWKQSLQGWRSEEWTASETVLVRSRLGPTPTYEVLRRDRLGPPA